MNLEVFDRVKIKETSTLEMFKGKEGTVVFFGNGGVNVMFENYPDPVPVLWSEIEQVNWESFGEEE